MSYEHWINAVSRILRVQGLFVGDLVGCNFKSLYDKGLCPRVAVSVAIKECRRCRRH